MNREQRETRIALLKILDEVGHHALRDEPKRSLWLSGDDDICFSSLELDSLAVMEFCASIESTLGHAVTPRQLGKFERLSELATWVSR